MFRDLLKASLKKSGINSHFQEGCLCDVMTCVLWMLLKVDGNHIQVYGVRCRKHSRFSLFSTHYLGNMGQGKCFKKLGEQQWKACAKAMAREKGVIIQLHSSPITMLEERNQDTSKVFGDGRQKLHNIRTIVTTQKSELLTSKRTS